MTRHISVDPATAVGTVARVPPAPEAFTPDPTALDRTHRVRARVQRPRPRRAARRSTGGRSAAACSSAPTACTGSPATTSRRPGASGSARSSTSAPRARSSAAAGSPSRSTRVDWHHLPIIERMWSEDDLVATTGAVDFLRDRYLDMLDSGGAVHRSHRRARPPTARRCCSTARRARTARAWSRPCCSAWPACPPRRSPPTTTPPPAPWRPSSTGSPSPTPRRSTR